MGSIGSKICYEHVSRDDPKQTIDSRHSVSISIFTDERRKKRKLMTQGMGGVPKVTYMLTSDTLCLGSMGPRYMKTSVSDNL